jgi:hypothetical protein
MLPTSSRLLLILLTVTVYFTVTPVRADIGIEARAVALPSAQLQGVQARLTPVEGGIGLNLSATSIDLPALGWRRLGMRLLGNFSLDAAQRWRFAGRIKLVGAPGAAVSDASITVVVDPAANTLQADIEQGKARLQGAMPLDQPSHVQLNLDGLPASWLQGLLSTLWSGRVSAGTVSADMALDLREQGLQASGQFTLAGGSFDTPGGAMAGQGLTFSGRLGVDSRAAESQVNLVGNLHGGELLLGPMVAHLPAHQVQLAVDASSKSGALELRRLRLGDADALQIDGALAFDAKGALKRVRFDRLQAQFPAAYQRYGQAWLATLGLRDMRTSGKLNASMDMEPDGLRSFAFATDDLDLADSEGRLAINGLRGGLDWTVTGDRPPTTLGWRSLHFYKIPNGAAQARWQSRDGELGLQQTLNVPVLGGTLRVNQLDWRPAAAKGQRLQTAFVLTGVDMAALSRTLGWPAFSGTLAGAVPSLRWVDDRFELAGGLSLNVFDGFVDVTRLSLQQPFGDVPVLSGDVSLRQLDLAALTGVFDFGSITGRLNGSIDDLRLVGWNPVAFKARLLAADGGRISQRAVNNLTSVGGGGLAGGLQGAILKLFKNFSYKRIGINCTLAGSVCHMSGLDNSKEGYTIVDGSGLPRLHVIGHQSEVDWPTLLNRLKAATEGAAPEIR